jgi:hypothetical protein
MVERPRGACTRASRMGNGNLGGAQKVARRRPVWTVERVVLDCLTRKPGRVSARPLVTVDVSPRVEGEHPSVRPSARVGAQKVARSGKLGNAWQPEGCIPMDEWSCIWSSIGTPRGCAEDGASRRTLRIRDAVQRFCWRWQRCGRRILPYGALARLDLKWSHATGMGRPAARSNASGKSRPRSSSVRIDGTKFGVCLMRCPTNMSPWR